MPFVLKFTLKLNFKLILFYIILNSAKSILINIQFQFISDFKVNEIIKLFNKQNSEK